jgi:hypothetical protein
MYGDAGLRIIANGRNADAANLEIRAGEIALGVADVRGVEDEIFEFVDLVRLQVLRGERRDGDRHRLDVFRPFLRGDDDFLDFGVGRRGKRARKQNCARNGQGASGTTLCRHLCSPSRPAGGEPLIARRPDPRGDSRTSFSRVNLGLRVLIRQEDCPAVPDSPIFGQRLSPECHTRTAREARIRARKQTVRESRVAAKHPRSGDSPTPDCRSAPKGEGRESDRSRWLR